MAGIVLNALFRSLAASNPAAFDVCPETMARYRKMAGIPNRQTCDSHTAELLVAALIYRPTSARELAFCWGQNRDEMRRLVVTNLTVDRVEISSDVSGAELRARILEATCIDIKSPRTLSNYAKELSERLRRPIVFSPDAVYPAAIATAFARLAVEKRNAQRQNGYKVAYQRWGYVPDVQIVA